MALSPLLAERRRRGVCKKAKFVPDRPLALCRGSGAALANPAPAEPLTASTYQDQDGLEAHGDAGAALDHRHFLRLDDGFGINAGEVEWKYFHLEKYLQQDHFRKLHRTTHNNEAMDLLNADNSG